MDILSGSYGSYGKSGAGYFRVLWGKKNGKFSKAKILKGTNKKPLIAMPELTQDTDFEIVKEIVGTRPTAADLNGDGTLDIIAGNRKGSFYFFAGRGKGKFAPKAKKLMVGPKPLQVPGHSDPFLIDWDLDGDLDIVSGSEAGGVMVSINEGTKKAFAFKPFTVLIEPESESESYDPVAELAGEEVHAPSRDTRVWVDDVDGDGKRDLLVGDRTTLHFPAEGVAKREAQAKLRVLGKKIVIAVSETEPKTKSLSDTIAKKETKLEEAGVDEAGVYEDAELKSLYDKLAVLQKPIDTLHEQRSEFVRSEETGFVWVYYQK